MNDADDLGEVREYFSRLIEQYGPTPKGADYNGEESQFIRYAQLERLFLRDQYSLLDFGSSYGAFAKYILPKGKCIRYCGYDILTSVVEGARKAFANEPRVIFTDALAVDDMFDYTIASGTFNYKGKAANEVWTELIKQQLDFFFEKSINGFASNFLTIYSDHDRMLSHLYYADPCALFDYCKRRYSRNVAILHDYSLYDFTLIVRK